ncbi:MAG: nitrilase-related carbon-nitrogen hydrolase [Luteolibacter sp.]|uniref:apolipoprotein N-acyltransferase n=1 Tax=Luteolibacter sp. TaxID=1962973 RepID=UPI003266AF66
MIHTFPARCGLAVLSGAAYSLAYPPLGWGWMVVPGLMGLLLALRGESGTRARAIGFLHGMAAYAIGLSWLFRIFGGVVVVLWVILAAFTALFAHMQGRAGLRGISGWKFAAFTAINWCGWEFIRAELFPLKFPWMSAGLAMGPNILLPWIGVYGVGVLVAFAAALMFVRRVKFAAAVIAILLAAMIFLPRCPEPAAADPLAVKVAGLQLEGVSLNEYLAGSRQMLVGIDHLVWPEYSVPFDIRTNKRDWEIVNNLCHERDITLTFGSKAGPGADNKWRNIALTLDPTGLLGEHTKVHPVHFFDDGTPGTTALPVPTTHGKVGTPICFDCDYEGVVRGMTSAGAEMFVVPTMDAETWTARQHDQHAELFRIRACENGRWLFVVATSGVSQIIDSNGQIHTRLDALKQGPISGILKRETVLTFYTRFGWLTPWCVLVVATVSWCFLLLPFKRGTLS